MASYGLLEQGDEDALHKSRLLNVEEKPFRRLTKRLLTPNSLISSPPAHLLTPPPDASNADEQAATQEAERQKQATEREQFREDVTLDFAAFESSIARVQLLLKSNEKERERYASEKVRILETAQTVRGSTAELHAQLEEARQTMAVRKTWDELTEKITSNRMLRPREDQHANLEKLNAEITDLERESHEYAQTWAERREQFGRIMKEGMELRRLIRDEKEEVERREGMEGREDVEEAASSSHLGTPRPETGGATPMHSSQDGEGHVAAPTTSSASLNVLKERPLARGSPLTDVGRLESPPRSEPRKEQEEEEDDSTMAEQGEIAEDGEVDPAKDGEDRMSDQREEGEEDETEEDRHRRAGSADQMDTT